MKKLFFIVVAILTGCISCWVYFRADDTTINTHVALGGDIIVVSKEIGETCTFTIEYELWIDEVPRTNTFEVSQFVLQPDILYDAILLNQEYDVIKGTISVPKDIAEQYAIYNNGGIDLSKFFALEDDFIEEHFVISSIGTAR
ncbi:MAG: hypothetical protein ATN35_13280 [Epulopiscium sp. Nele67-Bin004]|nr:MAG: hypothetical protein ATN35_13280 [Epulopiscium sp. Nele67-Bin004]